MISINRKDLPKANTICQICGHQYFFSEKNMKLRTSTIEPWRQYCDCIECYQLYTFLNKNIQEIDTDEYNRAIAIKLPDDKKMAKEAKQKFEEIKRHFYSPSKEIEKEQAEQQKPFQKNQSKHQSKNISNSKYLFNNK